MSDNPATIDEPDFSSTESIIVYCERCRDEVLTEVHKEIGPGAYLACAGLWIMHFICGCCLIPFCMRQFSVTKHFCSVCHNLLGQKGGKFSLWREFRGLRRMVRAYEAMYR